RAGSARARAGPRRRRRPGGASRSPRRAPRGPCGRAPRAGARAAPRAPRRPRRRRGRAVPRRPPSGTRGGRFRSCAQHRRSAPAGAPCARPRRCHPRPPVETRFDRDTGVRAVGPAENGVRTHEGRIDRGWWIVRGPNGGYVAALRLRALAAEVPAERAPRSLTVHYTAPPAEGAVRVETRVERVGRSLTTVSGRMLQGDRLLALALGAFSLPRSGPSFDHTRMPEAPPPEACRSFPGGIPMHERYEYRWAIGAPPRLPSAAAAAADPAA